MLVSTIISNGMSLADTPNTNFFTATDQLFVANLAWKKIYAKLCDWNADYFVTQVYTTLSAFTADSNRQFFYNYALPSDFYRLRLFQYQPDGTLYFPVAKMTLENYGNLQSGPGYRLIGTNLSIFTQTNYNNWCIFYYPAPATLSTSTDLVYPVTFLPEIMSYQIAVEVRRKQNLDFEDKQKAVNELMGTMLEQLDRDDAKAESPKNTFGQGFAPYI